MFTQYNVRTFITLVGAALCTFMLFSNVAMAQTPYSKVSSWAYQLQDPSADEIAGSPYDLVVIDYSTNGCEDGEFSKTQVEKMKKKPDGSRRIVLAYMSIGEAEPYRFYWQEAWNKGKPFWILEPNPKWPDNYRVEYWNGAWKKILFGSDFSYLDRIINAGFDGVYLDIVDGYEAFQKRDKYAKKNMLTLVKEIANYARKTKGKKDFGVFPQNAPELLTNNEYFEIISGIGKEELYFLDTDEPSSDEDRDWDEKLIIPLVKAGKLVLAVDYCFEEKHIAEARNRCKKNGFISYCTDVELDRLIKQKTK